MSEMKLVTFRTAERATHTGVVRDGRVIVLAYPTVLELLRDQDGIAKAQSKLDSAEAAFPLSEVALCSPIPEPPSVRDFYAFEQHVKSARAKRGLGMIPEWYEVPIFYFTNNSEIYGHDEEVPYPVGSEELDIELEIACMIGREGKDIPVEEAASYIVGYTIMNDWSARDFQRRDMKLNLGPGKGKDFATSLGPWLVTPDELATRHSGSGGVERMLSGTGEGSGVGSGANIASGVGASERYDLTMLARVNGQEISR